MWVPLFRNLRLVQLKFVTAFAVILMANNGSQFTQLFVLFTCLEGQFNSEYLQFTKQKSEGFSTFGWFEPRAGVTREKVECRI